MEGSSWCRWCALLHHRTTAEMEDDVTQLNDRTTAWTLRGSYDVDAELTVDRYQPSHTTSSTTGALSRTLHHLTPPSHPLQLVSPSTAPLLPLLLPVVV